MIDETQALALFWVFGTLTIISLVALVDTKIIQPLRARRNDRR